MAMRLSGLMSGMDTESIVQQLVQAKQVKVDTAKKDQTKLEWKQEIWKDLNKKLKSLQSRVGNLRFTSAYTQKTTKVSDSSAVSVITGEGAVNGVQDLTIRQLAKTAYFTGGKVSKREGASEEELSALTRMSDLMEFGTDADGNAVSKTITLTQGGKETNIELTANTTISDVLTQLKEQGLNASFDAKQQRFYISAKESGADGNFKIEGDDGALEALGLKVGEKLSENPSDEEIQRAQKYATYVDGQNAQIILNGALYESNNNVFEINGLTFTAQKEAENVTVTTQQDTDGIYDMIKGFLKEYNEIINEMDKLYNADSAKGYEPLTDEEKDAMSEKEIEKYEQKVKDSLLRRDSNISSLSSTLKKDMMSGIEINGKTMYLSNFGIETLNYFLAEDNEKNAYHIAGDPDDENTSGQEDKLKSMIASDPDTVVAFFTQLSKNLYDDMNEASKSVEGYRSFGSFYDDKKMKSDYDDYKTKIKDLETKLADYEDKWYAKFAAMETAMAKMQSNASAVTSLLGGSQ
ncbi:MAG: flagellar filament capping protein FliD [Roseburia sp.]|nr:flagellar filament capping protein FliD [Roseburia sp.]MCM1099050.1 flagellar filament capping protein FliD [Ruminococcus flavefaciens]